MSTMQSPQSQSARTLPSDFFRMVEFDLVTGKRSVAELLRDSLEDAESQLRLERRRARRAERRAEDLSRAVRNWQEMIEDYERATASTIEDRRN
jgi:hypothetical protein